MKEKIKKKNTQIRTIFSWQKENKSSYNKNKQLNLMMKLKKLLFNNKNKIKEKQQIINK